MNKEESKEARAILDEFLNGSIIQERLIDNHSWVDTTNPSWDFTKYEYRVKPPSYDDIRVDDKVLVRKIGQERNEWQRRHFAGVDKINGRPFTWINEGTSWTNDFTIAWDECKLAEEESE